MHSFLVKFLWIIHVLWQINEQFLFIISINFVILLLISRFLRFWVLVFKFFTIHELIICFFIFLSLLHFILFIWFFVSIYFLKIIIFNVFSVLFTEILFKDVCLNTYFGKFFYNIPITLSCCFLQYFLIDGINESLC